MNTPSERPGRTILSDSSETLLFKILLYVAGFGASVIISRGLGVEGRGVYYLPVVAAATVAAFANLGLEQANVYLLGTRRIAAERLWGQSGLIAAIMGIAGVSALFLVPAVFPDLFGETPTALLWLAGLSIPFALHTQFAAGLLTLRGEVTWQFRVSLVSALAQLGLLIGLVFTDWFTPAGVLAVALASCVLSWGLTATRLQGIRAGWIRWDAGLLRETLSHSLLLHLGSVLLFLHLRADMFMVRGMIDTAALGIYSLSVTLAETVLLATDSLAVAILPRQVGNTIAEAAAMALRGARTNLLIGLVLALGWVAVGLPLVTVTFGRDFSPAYWPLVTLLPGMIGLGLQRVCGGPLLRTGRPGRIMAVHALSLSLNVLLNRWWIPAWGGAGAALASTVSYGAGATIFLAWTSRLAGVSLRGGIVPTRDDLLALTSAVRRLIPRRGAR